MWKESKARRRAKNGGRRHREFRDVSSQSSAPRRFLLASFITAAASLALAPAPVMGSPHGETEALAMSKNKREVEDRERTKTYPDTTGLPPDTPLTVPAPTEPSTGPGSGTRTAPGTGSKGSSGGGYGS